MRYAIIPRDGDEPGFTIYMRVRGGFIMEKRPGERGLVHLIEHAAFQGSTHLAPGSLQRIAVPITFHTPSVATTVWSNSSYFLSSRTGDRRSLDTLLSLFREIAGELDFPKAGLRQARAEVVKEMGERRLGNQIFASYIAAVAPGSPNDVIQAQNSDDVPTASLDVIRRLYRRMYRPDRSLVVIVGKVDPVEAERLVAEYFADWRGLGRAPRPNAAPSFRRARIKPVSYSANAQGRSVVTISDTIDLPPAESSREQRIRSALMDLATTEMLALRLRRWQPQAPAGKVGVSIENAEGYRLVRFWDFVRPGEWRSVVAGLRDTVCAASTEDWSEQDWSAAKRAAIDGLQMKVADSARAKNFDVAALLADVDGVPADLLAPMDLLSYGRAWLPSVDTKVANAGWRSQWRSGVVHARVETPELGTSSTPLEDVTSIVVGPSRSSGLCDGAGASAGVRR